MTTQKSVAPISGTQLSASSLSRASRPAANVNEGAFKGPMSKWDQPPRLLSFTGQPELADDQVDGADNVDVRRFPRDAVTEAAKEFRVLNSTYLAGTAAPWAAS